MKIEILKQIPVVENIRPEAGKVYEVVKEKKMTAEKIYFIEVNGVEVGVYASKHRGECRIVPEVKEEL